MPLRQAFENSQSILLETTGDLVIEHASLSLETMLGFKPQAVMGRSLVDFAPVDQRNVWEHTLKNGGTGLVKLRSTLGRDYYFDVSVSPRKGTDRLLIVLHNVTALKTKNQELLKEKEQLDHFIYKVTHDLRSPVHSAMGLLELLAAASADERTRYLELIRTSLVKLEARIDEVDRFYRVDKLALRNEEIDLQRMIEEEIASLRNHPGGASISFDFGVQQHEMFFSDPLRLRTILGNLLSNAVKYSDGKKPFQFIRIQAEVSQGKLELAVSDNGIGIAPEHLNFIFDLFYRATTASQGSGLGLYIVKDTLQRLQGTIDVTSEPGAGTRFDISIPNGHQPLG